MKNKKEFTYLSLFSGCGGFDLGFKQNGFKCLGAYDINPHVVYVHSKNLKDPVFVHDLNDLNLPGELPNSVDVVVAGSPCQGFSPIGKRIVNDPRNHLLLTGGQVAIKYNAKVFVCENVPGSTSGEHKKYWVKLHSLLRKNGYNIKMAKYSAIEFGVPQLRKRIIMYAWKNDKVVDIEFPKNTVPNRNLKDILNGLEHVQNHNLDLIDKNLPEYKIAQKIRQGQKLCNVRGGDRAVHTWHIPEVFGKVNKTEEEFLSLIMKLRRQIRRRKNGDADPVEKTVLKSYYNGQTDGLIKSLLKKGYVREVEEKYIDLTNTFNGKYKRLNINSYSPTVDTRFGNYKNFIHPTEHRALSVREAARIQGFSDNFIFYGPIQRQYEMVGNAVPPPLASYVANIIKNFIIPMIA